MTNVQAYRHSIGVRLLQKGLYLLVVLDVGLGMGVEDERETESGVHQIGNPVRGVDQALPRDRVELDRSGMLACKVCVDAVDQDQDLGAEGGQQLSSTVHLPLDLGPHRRVVEMFHDEAAAHLQVSRFELGAQDGEVGGQVAVRPKLGPFVAGLGCLIHEALPRCLQLVAGEPHSPRVRRSRDPDVHRYVLRLQCGL